MLVLKHFACLWAHFTGVGKQPGLQLCVFSPDYPFSFPDSWVRCVLSSMMKNAGCSCRTPTSYGWRQQELRWVPGHPLNFQLLLWVPASPGSSMFYRHLSLRPLSMACPEDFKFQHPTKEKSYVYDLTSSHNCVKSNLYITPFFDVTLTDTELDAKSGTRGAES